MKAGWRTEPLGDLCEFQRGLTYAKSDEVDVSDNIVLRATNIDLATNLLDFDELKYINDKVVVPDSKKVRKDSLMICTASGSKSHLGKVAYIDDDYGYAFGGFMGMVTAKHGLVPKYLFHLMTSAAYKDFIGELSDGANINNLKFDDLRQFPVPHPSLGEQQRIVGILDKAFEGIATAKANAEQNLRNARALFEGYLWEVFGPNGKGWPTQKLGAVCEFEGGSQPPKSNFVHAPKTGYVRFLQIRDFGSDKYITFIPESKKNRLCRNDDIMIGRYGASVGKILTGQAGAYNVALIKTIPVARVLDRGFFHHYLMSDAFQERLRNVADRSAQNGFAKDDIQNFPIPLPSLREQQDIVSRLGLIRAKTQRLESTYQQKRDALDGLKKSLLHQAFTGGL